MQSGTIRLCYAITWIFAFASIAFAANCPEGITSNLTLGSDLVSNASSSHCVYINASDIVLDCAGYSIIGTDPTSGRYGVYIPDKNNITIKNCNIWNFSDGIRTSGGVSNSTFQNNTITRSQSGINIYVSGTNANNTITGNTIANTTVNNPYNYGYGIRIYVSSGSSTTNNITNNNISGTTLGIYLAAPATENLIANNIIINTSPIGIALDSSTSNNTVRDNTIYLTKYGVQLSSDSDNVVTGGSISNATTAFHLSYTFRDTIANVSLANISAYHIYSNASYGILDNNSFINISGLNRGQIGSVAGSNFTLAWYVRANVTNGTGPVDGANVTVFDGFGAPAWNATTDAQGMTPWKATNEAIYGNGVGLVVSYNNYTFNASYGALSGNTTYPITDSATVPVVLLGDVDNPAVSVSLPNQDAFFSPYEGLVNISVNATDSSGIDSVTANFSAINPAACGGIMPLSYNSTSGLWEGSCNISQYISGTAPSAAVVAIMANDTYGKIGTANLSLILHNLGVPTSNDPTNCTRFGSGTTNFSTTPNFGAVNFVVDYEMNLSCTNPIIANPNFTDGATINLTSVNLSTKESADKLANLSSAINVTIGQPGTFEISRIYVNTTYFQELNTGAIITLFNLPFMSQPAVEADNASRQGSISVTSWTPTNLSLITGDVLYTGTLRFSVSGFSGYNVSENVTPAISIASPANGNQTNLTSVFINVTVNGTGTEPSLIIITINSSPQQRFTYNATNGSVTNNTANCTNTTADGEVLRCLRSSTALGIGSYSLTVLAYDFANPEPGNNATASSGFEITSAPDQYEPDENISTAQWIANNGTPQTHTFHRYNDTDFVKFNATKGYAYSIWTRNLTSASYTDTEMGLYNSSGTMLAYSDDIVLGENRSSEIWFYAPATAVYYVAVDELYGETNGSYLLYIQQRGILVANITGATRNASRGNATFNISASVTCVGGPCGNVSAYLDPLLEGAGEKPKTALEAAANGPIEIIVMLKEQPKEKSRQSGYSIQSAVLSALSQDDFELRQSYASVNGFSGKATQAGIGALLANPDVESIRASRTFRTMLDVSVPLVNATALWNTSINGQNINGTGRTVCIIDTGVNYTHPDFGSCTLPEIGNGTCAKIAGGRDFVNGDDDFMDSDDGHGGTAALGHGTHVSGIVGSIDGTYAGMAPGARIAMAKVCDSNNTCSEANMISGIEWCINNSALYNISAISISLGSSDCLTGSCDGKACDNDDSPAMVAILRSAYNANIPVMAASGNENLGSSSNVSGISSPACISTVISVGATDDSDVLASLGNRDRTLDMLAPGVNIEATDYAGTHTLKSGTSMATPHVSGAAALLNQFFRQKYSRAPTSFETDAILKTGGKSVTDTAGRINLTYPRLNVLGSSLDKGIISTTTGAKPFYTKSSNPSNSTCYRNMAQSLICNTTWLVNATGDSGVYSFFVIYSANATDQGGAQMEFGRFYSGTYNISIDNIGPNVSLVSPASGNLSSSANLTLTFNATDDFDINISCTLYVDAASRGTFAVQNGTSNDYSSNYSNGFHRWNVSCADDALTSVSSETRNFTVDLINPMITIVSPSTAYYGTGSVLINISANDTNKDKTWFFTNGTANITYTVPVTLNFSDGMYNMTAYVNDSAGRTNTTNRTFIVDTTAPTISFADPTPNSSAYATKSYVAINASASDANFANITIRIYNSTGGLRNSSFSNSSSTLFANFTGLSNGVYYFNATVYDRVGLYNFTETRNVTVDFTGPAISFASPSDNTSSLSRDYISANVSAPGADLANMTIYLYNATSLLNFTNSTSSPLFANFSGLGNGIYYVNATAFDNAGNLNKTETRTITLDTAAPGVALGAPANGSFTSLASVNTSFTAVDALAANTSCRLYVDGTIRANITAANNTLMSQLYNYTAGTHNWSVNCTDFANNTGASDVWNFTVDLTNPTITIDSPWLSYYYNTSSIWINISANDTNLDTVWFYTNDTNVTYTPPGIPFVLGFDDGVYNMTAWVNDSAGRTVSSGRTFTVDTAAPTVSIQSPANTTYNTSNLGLDFTASDTYLESCWYSIGGGNATPISGCANGSDIVGLANGSQCISVFANDSAGNVNNDTVCLTLELAPESNPPVYSGLVPSENYNYTYRPDVIYYLYANWTDDTGIGAVLIENNFSGTDANDTFTGQNGSRFEYYIGVYLAAGQYSYRWLANDTFGNLNDSMPYRNITVLQADPNATISAVSWAGTWPYQSTVNCTGESQVNMTLYRNNTLVGSGFGFAQDIRNLSAGVYNYTCNTSGNGNYTSDSASATLTISRMNATVNISVSPSLTVNWSTATNVSCSASSLLNISLYRNGTLIGTGMGHVENVANLSAGTYNYSCNISANENHTANSTLRTLTVNRATPNLTLLLDGSAANIDIDPYDTLDMDANVTAPAGGYIELYVDSALFNRGNALLSNSTSWSSSGTHTIKVVFNITANYSASSLSRTVTVSSSGGGGGGGGGGSGLPYMKITNYTTCNRDNTSNVRVVVVSAANSTPLNIVTVFTDYNNMYTAYTTGYTFRDLADGTYTIHAEKNGYRDTTLTVSLNCTPRTVAPQNQTGGGTPTQNKTSNGTITQNKTAGGSVSVAYSSNGTDRTVNVTLAGIGPNYATYKVGNLTSAIKVSVGQNLTVDVDSDGTPDIYIKLNSVTANSASAIMGAMHALPPGQGEGGCVLDNEVCAADSECCSGKCVNEVCTSGISLDGIINPIKSLVAEMGDKLPQVLAAMLVPLALMAIAIAAGYFLFLRKGIGKKRN